MTVIALHGWTQRGQDLADALGPLLPGVICPDAPFEASAGGRTWWHASDDGRTYAGWPETRERLRALLEGAGPDVALLGFSQGAMVAACAAAWSARGELPPIARVALVAGMVPRAPDLRALLEPAVPIPSLHVVGSRDPLAAQAPALAERFRDARRIEWGGPHVIPTRGPAWEELRSFLLAGRSAIP